MKKSVCKIKKKMYVNKRDVPSATLYSQKREFIVSWIKTDQLDVTCFIISLFTAQHVSNVSTSILWSLRLICRVISCVVLLWFDVCWCYGVVRLGWSGIWMQAEALVLATYCGFISWVVLFWFDVCWCYGVVRLGWCGIIVQAEALVLLLLLNPQ